MAPTTDWSEAEDDGKEPFAAIKALQRTPVNKHTTPNNVPMAPQRPKTTLKGKNQAAGNEHVKGASESPSTSTSTDHSSPNDQYGEDSTPENAIEALKKVQETLKQKTIRSDEKSKAERDIKLAIAQLVAMNKKLEEYQNQQGNQQPNDCHDLNTRLGNIEQELANIKKAIMEPTRSYAQATQATQQTAPKAEEATPEKKGKERKPLTGRAKAKKRNQDNAKFEIKLSASKATDEIKNKLDTMHPKEIIDRLNKIVKPPDATKPDEKPEIKSINKLSNNVYRLHCKKEEDIHNLQNTDWNKAFKGLEKHTPRYKITVHGVNKADLDVYEPNEEEILELTEQNNIQIDGIGPLLRKPNDAKSHSITLSLLNAEEADRCINEGIIINYCHYYNVEKYTPQYSPTLCYKCLHYGHKASQCKRPQACMNCSGKHHVNDCTSETLKCAGCGKEHQANHRDCEKRLAEKYRLEEESDNASAYYTK